MGDENTIQIFALGHNKTPYLVFFYTKLGEWSLLPDHTGQEGQLRPLPEFVLNILYQTTLVTFNIICKQNNTAVM